eukprot:11600101-Alexandrium_andersonii.AAC.1
MSPFPPFDPVEDRVRASGRVGDPEYVALITLHTKSVLRDLQLYRTMAGALVTRDVIDPEYFKGSFLGVN